MLAAAEAEAAALLSGAGAAEGGSGSIESLGQSIKRILRTLVDFKLQDLTLGERPVTVDAGGIVFAVERAFASVLDSRGAHIPDAEISPYLNGHVKPYDVCALIFALPDAASAFDLRPRLEEAKGTTHRFYLEPSAMISLEKITKLLSETFLEVCEGFSGLEAASWSADRYQPASSTTSTGTSASSAGDAAPAPAQTRTAAS